MTPNNTDVVILCGGVGSRLKSVVSDRPKPMAEIGERPFLDILVDYVVSFNFKRIILCTGYGANYIREYYNKHCKAVDIVCSEEGKPLGTAGAIKNAEKLLRSDPFLVMNGDSFCNVDLVDFIRFHTLKKAVFSMALAKADDSSDTGSVKLDDDKKIVSFQEKAKSDKGYVNAGGYLFDRQILSLITPDTKVSLELDIFPQLAGGDFFGYVCDSRLIDIGTPERYARAGSFFK